MKRPIIWANIFLALGILSGQLGASQTVLFLLPAAGLCLCFFMQYRYWPVFLFLLFALAGAWRVNESLRDPMDGGSLRVEKIRGVVTEKGTAASGGIKLTVELESPAEQALPVKRVMIYTGIDADIGGRVIFSGELLPLEKSLTQVSPLEPPPVDKEFDEFMYLRAKKIDAKIFTWEIETADEQSESLYIRLLVFLRQARDRLAAVYDSALPYREAGIMKSLLLGDKSGLDEDSAELYRVAGIYHLLCISGLHIGIFMLAAGRLFKILMNGRYAWLAALSVLILYTLLTGASVSTVRAATMGGVFVFSKFLFRDYDLPASTGFACAALLLYEPLYLYEAGFQLSFGAVFGIAALTAPIERGLSKTLKKLPFKNSLAACVSATAATYPILMYHFHEISVYAVPVNLFVVPTAAVLVVFGLLAGLAGLIWLPAAAFLAGVSFYLLKFYDAVCLFFGSLPFAAVVAGPVSLLMCALMYAAIAGFAMAMSQFAKLN